MATVDRHDPTVGFGLHKSLLRECSEKHRIKPRIVDWCPLLDLDFVLICRLSFSLAGQSCFKVLLARRWNRGRSGCPDEFVPAKQAGDNRYAHQTPLTSLFVHILYCIWIPYHGRTQSWENFTCLYCASKQNALNAGQCIAQLQTTDVNNASV